MKNKIKRALLCILGVVVVALTTSMSVTKFKPIAQTKTNKTIIRLWQIDTFEGGTGSRDGFLSRVALEFEDSVDNVFVMVTSHTIESATLALENGNVPDIISYGLGFENIIEYACVYEKLSAKQGIINNGCFAVPWCRGGYALFTLGSESDFADVSSENTVIAMSGNDMGEVVLALSGHSGNFEKIVSTNSYVKLIDKKYKYMLGTQRDIYRFISRNVEVCAKPLSSFSDLFQYVSITTKDEKKASVCFDFVYYLLSDKVQNKLSNIGLMSVSKEIYSDENTKMKTLEKCTIEKTLNAFSNQECLIEVKNQANKAILGDSSALKNLQNYLV